MDALPSATVGDWDSRPDRTPAGEPARRTALDPTSLLAEVNLLMDYVSGRPDMGLDGGKPGRLPKGMSYDDALVQFFLIREKATIAGDDLRFLVSFRDYLNSAAYPASGRTVAFSTLVTCEAVISPKAIGDAVCAYPEYVELAKDLRVSMRRLLAGALIATLIVGGLAAYVFSGNLIVSRIITLGADYAVLDSEIEKEEMAVKPVGSEYLRLCQTPDKQRVYPSIRAMHLCDQASDIGVKMHNSYADLHRSFSLGLSANDGFLTDQNAVAILAVLNGYTIPVLMGFLGSAAYVLRLYLRNLGGRLLTPRDARSNAVRMVLGTLSGLAIGFFLSPSAATAQIAAPAGSVISLTAPALGFLAGYAVDVLFKFLDNVADTVFIQK